MRDVRARREDGGGAPSTRTAPPSRSMSPHATPSTLGPAYERLRPLMLAELARLAREGVAVAPHDGLDFVHGFFLDEWPRTQASYHEAESALWTYVRQAFRRYVWREVRREGLRTLTVGSGSRSTAQLDPADRPEPYDLDRVRAALDSLDAAHTEALWSYLATASERATGRRLGLSRSRTRTLLEEAIALVATSVEPRDDVSEANTRDADALFDALRAALPTPTPHAPVPLRADPDMTVADLLRPYVSTDPLAPEDRKSLRDNAHAVVEALDAGDPAALAVIEGGGGSPEAYEALYQDLAHALQVETEEAVPLTASPSDLDQEAEIGRLFLELVEAHPLNGKSLEMAFGVPRDASPETFDLVYNSTPAAHSAGSKGAFLAGHGLSPMDFFQAADAVGDLVERIAEDTDETVCLAEDGTLERPSLSPTLFVDEVAHVTGLGPEQAQGVLEWLLGTAKGGAPAVFTGVRAEESLPCSVVLQVDPDLFDAPLGDRWGGLVGRRQ